MNIQGRAALISGAAAGIGRATAVTLANKGARRIVLVDIDAPGLAETARQVERAGALARTKVVDVTDGAALEALFDAAFAEGALDIVFNNAGILSGPPAFPDTPLARIRQVVAINFTAVIEATWHAIRLMRAARRAGVIINTSSTGGLSPYLSDAPYAATKAGVLMYSRSCGPLKEIDGIRVNAVCPGRHGHAHSCKDRRRQGRGMARTSARADTDPAAGGYRERGHRSDRERRSLRRVRGRQQSD